MATQVILLERIESLGGMGDIVNVKPGYARNYLLPQKKALRATQSNIAYFETQKAALQKINNEKKAAAEKHAQTLKGLTVSLIRQAGEAGQLYGSVSSRDIADAINAKVDQKIDRNMVDLNQSFKEIGLFPVKLTLHSEVKIDVTINVARTEEEAKAQLKSGKAATAVADAKAKVANDSKADLMEEGAYSAEQQEEAEEAAQANASAEAKAKKAEAKKSKKAKKSSDEEGDDAEVAETKAEADEE